MFYYNPILITSGTVFGGQVRLTPYKFTYELPKSKRKSNDACTLTFQVTPHVNPPSNIHVLIGRNGVGKTRILKLMTHALIEKQPSSKEFGQFLTEQVLADNNLFANLVSVTFSAFDPFGPIQKENLKDSDINYSYVGLKRSESKSDGKTVAVIKTDEELKAEFVSGLGICRTEPRARRWKNALSVLESDLIFKEAEIASLNDIRDTNEFRSKAEKIFERLSSGHKIILLTLARLVETVAERTLVLIDEPEAHLHPPLLSAFLRALSDLLIDRNGVAIIATHSPVVLQEVPKSCVWKLSRSGVNAKVERPEIETFGENVGVLTREIFGLEVTHSGFHKLIQEEIHKGWSYWRVVEHFNEEIGAEAKAIIQALIAARDKGE